MHLTKLTLKNFRCYTSKYFEFNNGINLIIGPNGAGKSSLLEAIWYAFSGKSPRQSRRSELLAMGLVEQGQAASIQLDIQGGQESANSVSVGFNQSQKLLKIGQSTAKSHAEIAEIVSCLILQQDDIELVIGSPSVRRGFLDQLCCAITPQALKKLCELRVVLANRKALLESDRINESQLKLWTEKLWLLWSDLRESRSQALATLQTTIAGFDQLPDNLRLQFSYPLETEFSPGIGFENFWRSYWLSPIFYREKKSRRNLFGPQVEDFSIANNNQPLKNYASRGEAKQVAFFLKMGCAAIMRQAKNKAFTLLVDDFFAEMDVVKTQGCMKLIKSLNCQVIIVTTSNHPSLSESGAVVQNL